MTLLQVVSNRGKGYVFVHVHQLIIGCRHLPGRALSLGKLVTSSKKLKGGHLAQQLRCQLRHLPPTTEFLSSFWTLAPDSSFLLMHTLEGNRSDTLTVWIPVTHVGGLDWIPGFIATPSLSHCGHLESEPANRSCFCFTFHQKRTKGTHPWESAAVNKLSSWKNYHLYPKGRTGQPTTKSTTAAIYSHPMYASSVNESDSQARKERLTLLFLPQFSPKTRTTENKELVLKRKLLIL